MTPPPVDRDVVGRRLRAIADALATLASVEDRTVTRLRADPVTAAAVERLLQVMVDLAVDVNAHIVSAERGEAPTTARRSFEMAAEIGLLADDHAGRLAVAAGLRNVLVHRYVDIDTDLVAEAAAAAPGDFGRFVRDVASWLERRG